MFGLFDNKSVLDEDAVRWMFDCYAWALRNTGADYFYEQTRLVLPTNEFFPGEAASPESKAQLILEQVSHHAGVAHWPVKLVDEDTYLDSSFVKSAPRLTVTGNTRGKTALQPVLNTPEDSLFVLHQPQLLPNPQALIANYAQMLGNYLGYTVTEPPPGGVENWPMLTEMLAIYMGFGLMYVNTAGNVRISSCGSCQGPAAERVNYLSQYDAAYSLAIFTKLKDIEFSSIKPYLKKTMHTFFKKAQADVGTHAEELQRLKEMKP